MREREPIGQLSRGLIWGLPIKRHHGGRETWRAEQLRAPTVADGHDLDEVRAPADGFFEAMNGHYVRYLNRGGTAAILRLSGSRSSEAPREGGVHNAAHSKRRSILRKKNLW